MKRVKTGAVTAAAAGCMVCAAAQGTELVRESFVYDPGPLTGSAGGIGWEAPWLHTATLDQANVTSPGLSFAGVSSTGNKATTGTPGVAAGISSQSFRRVDVAAMPNHLTSANPNVTAPEGATDLVGAPGQTLWLSFLAERHTVNEAGAGGFTGLSLFITSADHAFRWEHLFIGIGTNETQGYKLQGGNGGALTNSNQPGAPANPRTGIDPNDLAHVVARIDYRRDPDDPQSLNDIVYLWIDPQPGDFAQSTNAIVWAESTQHLRFNTLRVGGTGNASYDEIRIATSPPGVLPGDANRDGRVDGEDFLIWQANFGTQSGAIWDRGDFNGDGRVDGEDFLVWQANFGSIQTTSAVTPEPGVLGSVTALGSLLMLRRRRS